LTSVQEGLLRFFGALLAATILAVTAAFLLRAYLDG